MHEALSSLESTGNNDEDFVQMMLPHHQVAIDMAKVELVHGQDPRIPPVAIAQPSKKLHKKSEQNSLTYRLMIYPRYASGRTHPITLLVPVSSRSCWRRNGHDW